MKSYLGRILICVVPVVLGIAVCAWAFYYGKFRLGVDLVGGTILVYEVDRSKMTDPDQYKPEDLAAALKRRIDPADLYNVTIRPAGGETPRVEIILPTGGQGQQNAETTAWENLLEAVAAKYPPRVSVPLGQKQALVKRISENHPDVKAQDIAQFVDSHYKVAKGRRALTGEEVENIKNLIQQQGLLEFRILANPVDDGDAIKRAETYLKNPDNAAALERLEVQGDPPPPPLPEGGGKEFAVTLSGETLNYTYSWVEVGKEELYSLHLNNAARKAPAWKADWEAVAAVRDKEAIRYPLQGGGRFLLYSREIKTPSRLSPKDVQQGKEYEYFILTRNSEPGKEITGKYLSQAASGPSSRGEPAVHFGFDSEGGNLFYELTSLNKPAKSEGSFERQLAIVLDGKIRAAPGLRSAIRDRGEISGGFTQKTVQELVTILRAGALPATLKEKPVSENSMGPTLGADTIKRGTYSVAWAFLAVMLFMLFYYRFAGIVACVALLANLVLTVAFMVLVNATFTLPGLAGLVLMLGMAVDANVLIYERLREERERGASLALAIRNGYDRAFPTIIDTHLSSIFTAIVLYVVGNDQLKGFGISLTMGLIISLFTSLFMTRTMFDFWLSKNWLHNLSMRQLFHRPNIDFMGIRYYWFTATIILTVVGAALFVWRLNPAERGGSVMNIDFIGGTAYTGKLATPLTIDELRAKLEKNVEVPGMSLEESDLPDLSIEQIFLSGDPSGRSSLFTARTADKNSAKVQKIVNTRLGDALQYIKLHKAVIDPKNPKIALLEFTTPKEDEPDYASPAQVTMLLHEEGLSKFRIEGVPRDKDQPTEQEKIGRFSKLKVELTDPLSREKFESILAQTKTAFDSSPQPERLENFDAQLAANTQERALYAILASWAAILLYLWFRFGNWTFGAAAVLCLLHDLFFTLGIIAGAHYLHGTWLGNLLAISDFKIDLPAIAALLTLVGYSVNDTIVVFDRIREVRGKNPILTATMINDSVNQTLSRTVLASLTVWLVVIVLYAFGGEGVHLFAFVMIVGVIVGTYSSIYIASPLLLIFGEGTPSASERSRQAFLAAAEKA